MHRYKEKVDQNIQNDILKRSLPVLKSISDDVIGILIIIVVLFLTDLLSKPLESLQSYKFLERICLERCILLATLILLLVITIDITFAIGKLINGLFDVPTQANEGIFDLSINERNLILATRKLDPKHMTELLEYIETLVVKQELNK